MEQINDMNDLNELVRLLFKDAVICEFPPMPPRKTSLDRLIKTKEQADRFMRQFDWLEEEARRNKAKAENG